MDLFFSTGVFKGFNGIVKSTGPWVTVSKTVDLTKAFYGTKPRVVNTAFNFLKWMLRINSIKNLFKKSFITITFYKIYCILYLTNIQLLILVPGFITLSNFFVYSV